MNRSTLEHLNLPPTLKDPSLEKALSDKGHVVIENGLSSQMMAALNDFYRNHFTDSMAKDSAVFSMDDPQTLPKMSQLVRSSYLPFLETHFVGHRAAAGHFIIKIRGENNGVQPHQEYTMIDESKFRSIHLWSPLIDVGEQEGAVQVLEGSHQLSNIYRGQSMPSPYSAIFDDFVICKNEKVGNWPNIERLKRVREKFKTIEVKAGDVLIFDSSLIHSSHEMMRDITRIAVGAQVVPKHADLIHYCSNDNGLVREYSIDDSFFISYKNGDTPSDRFNLIREFKHDFSEISEKDIQIFNKILNKDVQYST